MFAVMSSQDSMGIVFKCLSKGAVDFLVKPIRKNELKNLWQHVWRRCHSSSGSGSESGTHTKKSAKSKSNDSENNSSCGDEQDNGYNTLNIRDGSDNGSGTQSSWTKKAADVDSPQPLSPSYHLTDAPDSICAQVIHNKPESFSNGWVHVSETKDGHEQNEQHDDIAMGKDLEIGVSEDPEKLFTNQTRKRHSKLSEVDNRPFDNEQLQRDNESARGKWRDQAAGVISTNATNPLAEGSNFDAINGPSDISRVKVSSDCGEMPSLELTLKRLRGVEVGRSAANDDCNVLRHSDFSAFSKYNTASSANQAPTGNAGSCSPLDNGSVAMKTETMQNFPSHSNGPPLNQQSNGSSNNNDMASTAKYSTSKPEALNDKSESISAFKPFHYSAFQSLQNGRIYSSQQVLPEKADDMGVNTIQAQLRGTHHLVHVQNHQHHHCHYHQRDHNVQHYQSQQDQDDLSVKNMAAAAPQCGSSNVFEGTTETNVGNYSVNGSASGSNHGSNGQNGSSTGLNAGITNLESDKGAAGKSGVSGNIVDEERAAQREAALMKFRQKRKERCFGKRVRYHSRKKLAEQRPRVRGQFVRQTVSDSKAGKDYSTNDLTSDDNSGDNLR
ncbi:two-component response regulator-like PRR37 isoform X2 [Pistacia vera]|uniref:two-component response regulator-like PRR37 isoform X2 n=1 Tax=Pistacia vera TaxID=55513 RepID=UPI0012639B74|nr:two-component response regulator-like PRR37 isoform X2 [Pistacia vera]